MDSEWIGRELSCGSLVAFEWDGKGPFLGLGDKTYF